MGLKDYIKKQYKKQKEELAEARKFRTKLNLAKQKAYREELLKEKVIAAKEVAKVQTALKMRKWKEKIGYTPSKIKKTKITKFDIYDDVTKGLIK